MSDIKALIQGNRNWVDRIKEANPDFFTALSEGQTPKFLWIGCSDSRVPATQITDTVPGSIFVHRNIANMVVHTDANLLSVVYYAVKVLKVKHIIVCGHYGCGGVKAAMENVPHGFIDNWLRHIKDVYRLHQDELDVLDDSERFKCLVEWNVKEQVYNLTKISFIQDEWQNGEFPYIHGWVYSLENGMVKDLGVSVNHADALDPVFRYEG